MQIFEKSGIGATRLRWTTSQAVGFGALLIAVHVLLLMVVIPEFSGRLTASYNQDVFADGYDYLAANLAAGNGYRFYPDTARTLMREPGYPMVLAGLRLAFGEAFIAVKLFNLLLALATAFLITLVIGRFCDRWWAKSAGVILFLFHPGTLIAESRGGVEILFGFLIALFILILYRAIESGKTWVYAADGLVLGLCVSVRSVPLLFPAFLLAYLLVFERNRVSPLAACRNIIVMLLAMFAVLTPWILRNYSLTGRIVPTASVLGVSVQAGQYIFTHRFEGKPWWLLDREAALERDHLATQLGYPFKDAYYQTFYRTEDEINFSAFLLRRVVGVYKSSPGLFLSFVTHNLFNFWFTGKNWAATWINLILQLPYLALAAIGTFVGLKSGRRRIVAPIILLMGYIISVYVPILAQARYSVPLIPLLSILATIALISARKKMEARASSLHHRSSDAALNQ